ncbi:MAG: BsaWI family type II restriction enzyme [Candidatus Binataceae bacterium]
MLLNTKVNGVAVVINLPGLGEKIYATTKAQMEVELGRPDVKNREIIANAFLFALKRSPKANASDLWHHVVYRLYCDLLPAYRHQDPKQSWVRASGDALEITVERIYSAVLRPHGIAIRALIGKDEKQAALEAMALSDEVGGSKLDVGLYLKLEGTERRIFGGVHVKASLAERVSDDVPASRAMMRRGYFSPLWTLDVKSFPPPHGNLINRGELGTPDAPSDKRKYIEQHGSFDNCYSANSRTVPSRGITPSGKRIYTLNLLEQPDQFA